jgi:hydrogenase maturation protein HypF
MKKRRMLVHVCCAPDALYVMDILKKDYDVSGFFCNPNIHPAKEYRLRLEETQKVAQILGFDLIEDDLDSETWLKLTEKFKDEPEKGRRCDICYAMRLDRTAQKAAEGGFDTFTTVMSLSPWKKSKVMNRMGRMFAKRYGIEFFEADFKKKDGFKKSVDLSKEHQIYRQDYCGCVYSKRPTKGAAIDIVVFGVVQGVGFRPFIYRIAKELGYTGWVKNIGRGVEIHLESRTESKSKAKSNSDTKSKSILKSETDFDDFFAAFERSKPPLAQVEDIKITPSAPFHNCRDFIIKKTKEGSSFVFISPDISVCENCKEEMMSPHDRRHHYPFINCTDCGPRYTIVEDLPYDRDQTTMRQFLMCADCREEYQDPLDRRYHAQPIACPKCGPHVSLINAKTNREIKGGIVKAASLIKEGKILAIKGLGGFHLVCDPSNYGTVKRLREIKERKTKPLALMARDLSVIKKYAEVGADEETQLLSARRPIVLLKKTRDIRGIAPRLKEMGFMLPYTPLHNLLLEKIPLIVATSSNQKDSPIMKDVEEGIENLCDYVLTHNRPIHMRADDSVMKVVGGEPLFLRRARGYVPYPQQVPAALESPHHVLALGGELKDTISIYKSGYVVTSQFLGDLDDYKNFQYFEETIAHLKRLFELKPKVVVSDLHPNFHTTRYAERLGLRHIQVQHHYAHVLAVLLEHKIPPGEKALGVSLDGYGYGEDGTAWGAEFLLADYESYQRLGHFKYVPLPGGDLASKQPWRMAIAYLYDAFGVKGVDKIGGVIAENIDGVNAEKIRRMIAERIGGIGGVSTKKRNAVVEMIERGINSPMASSCGRLFDAVSFLVGLAPKEMEFEAEAPMRLESAADDTIRKSYRFTIIYKNRGLSPFFQMPQSQPFQISFSPTIRAILNDLNQGVPPSHISAKFHTTLARVILKVAERARQKHNIETVALSGGVFLNKRLLTTTVRILEHKGFKTLRPVVYSPNDESISVGQIAYALNVLQK